MNYIVVYKQKGRFKELLFKYRDETEIAYSEATLIRNEDDVIKAMQFFSPDKDRFVIRETMLVSISEDTLAYLRTIYEEG